MFAKVLLITLAVSPLVTAHGKVSVVVSIAILNCIQD